MYNFVLDLSLLGVGICLGLGLGLMGGLMGGLIYLGGFLVVENLSLPLTLTFLIYHLILFRVMFILIFINFVGRISILD